MPLTIKIDDGKSVSRLSSKINDFDGLLTAVSKKFGLQKDQFEKKLVMKVGNREMRTWQDIQMEGGEPQSVKIFIEERKAVPQQPLENEPQQVLSYPQSQPQKVQQQQDNSNVRCYECAGVGLITKDKDQSICSTCNGGGHFGWDHPRIKFIRDILKIAIAKGQLDIASISSFLHNSQNHPIPSLNSSSNSSQPSEDSVKEKQPALKEISPKSNVVISQPKPVNVDLPKSTNVDPPKPVQPVQTKNIPAQNPKQTAPAPITIPQTKKVEPVAATVQKKEEVLPYSKQFQQRVLGLMKSKGMSEEKLRDVLKLLLQDQIVEDSGDDFLLMMI